jgi:hypothetical protein
LGRFVGNDTNVSDAVINCVAAEGVRWAAGKTASFCRSPATLEQMLPKAPQAL